jgi:hypothetical protein
MNSMDMSTTTSIPGTATMAAHQITEKDPGAATSLLGNSEGMKFAMDEAMETATGTRVEKGTNQGQSM